MTKEILNTIEKEMIKKGVKPDYSATSIILKAYNSGKSTNNITLYPPYYRVFEILKKAGLVNELNFSGIWNAATGHDVSYELDTGLTEKGRRFAKYLLRKGLSPLDYEINSFFKNLDT